MIQRRQDAERERIEIYEATLRRVARPPRLTPDFSKAIDEASRGFSGEVVRDAQSWHPQMKTRDAARLRLAAARHLFALYPVPATLEQVWLDDAGLDAQEVRLRKQWYVVAARGGSLYKAGAGQWLTRKEVPCLSQPARWSGFRRGILVCHRSLLHGCTDACDVHCTIEDRACAAQRTGLLARCRAVLLRQPVAGGSDRRSLRLLGRVPGPRRAGSRCGSSPRVLGCDRSSMAEPWAVNPLVPVRLRPVTPKRMRHPCVANSSGRVPGSYPGGSGFESLATHQHLYPSWRNRQTQRSQKPWPQGMSVRLGPRGPHQHDRRCHEASQERPAVLVSRSRASAARASHLRRRSSAASASCTATSTCTRSWVETIHARAAPARAFKRCCLRSGCF